MTTTRTTIICALLARAAIATAGGDSELEQGKTAMKAGRVHDACQAFEQSDKLEARIDTELLLADCYEQDGRLASAARLYRALAEQDSNADRRKTSTAKATKLEARAPKLRILPSQRPDGLVIKVDGTAVSLTGNVYVDVGPHEVLANAPHLEGHASVAIDRERQLLDVIVRMEATGEPTPAAPKTEPAPAPKVEPAPAPSTPAPMATEPSAPAMPEHATAADHGKRNGLIIAGAGAAVVAGGAIFLGLASSKMSDEHALCPNSRCANDTDLAQAHSLISDAHTDRNVGLAMGIGGLAAIGVGAYFYFTARDEESHVALDVGRSHAGIAYTGRF